MKMENIEDKSLWIPIFGVLLLFLVAAMLWIWGVAKSSVGLQSCGASLWVLSLIILIDVRVAERRHRKFVDAHSGYWKSNHSL